MITDRPCPASHDTAWARRQTPEGGYRPVRRTPVLREPPSQPGRRATYGISVDRAAENRCAAAKREEARYREARGLDIRHAELRRLTDMVYDACK